MGSILPVDSEADNGDHLIRPISSLEKAAGNLSNLAMKSYMVMIHDELTRSKIQDICRRYYDIPYHEALYERVDITDGR